MFALNETAFLYANRGQRGGKSVYADTGATLRCRSEPAWIHRASGSAVERVADTRIFACVARVYPGDRLVLNGRCYRIAEVQPMRGWCGIHHLEILARDEGPADRVNNNA